MIKIDLRPEVRLEIEKILCDDAFSSNENSLYSCLSRECNETFLRDICPPLHDFLYDKKVLENGFTPYALKCSNVKKLLTARYDELLNFAKLFGKKSYGNSKTDKIIKKRWKEIFQYKAFSQRTVAKTILTLIGMDVCPYCNRHYTTTVDSEGICVATIDHFLCKSKYPYLALSVWNMVPSCSYCNRRKSDKDLIKEAERILYPYSEEFGEKNRFYVDIMSYYEQNHRMHIAEVLEGISKDFNIGISTEEEVDDVSVKVANQEKLFSLTALYNTHKDYVRRLLRIKYITTESYVKDLQMAYPTLFHSEEDVLETIYINYARKGEWSHIPLSKLTYDILHYEPGGVIK